MEVINIQEKFTRVEGYWNPHIVAELNGQQVKLARLKGEFVWHHHETEDELFYVLKGTLRMAFRDKEVSIGPGECIVVPRGVEHKPIADEEVEIMLFEPASTVNTGNLENERTRTNLQKI
ncbi:cupin domain-containing protein [Cytophagales bacterium LB-30]|uniref:Cupin domain-containing protein n=1 Tax=Shiella aurantiaca TaxID=3058365 RepID=A0ABT8F876_9BACT|nr:cupin domain-containing protein [Shiella aurantiaca]MDN4166681.1 cupin domain-containing protein [Shiella aurantiaca]